MTKKQLEIWQKLYSIAITIGEYEPWEIIDEFTPLIYIPESGNIEVIFSIIGANSDVCGIACYFGKENFINAKNRMDSPNSKNEPVVCMQNAVVALWGSREDVNKENKALLKELGLKCRGEGGWLHFENYRERYVPRALTDEEAKLTEDALGNLYMMLKAVFENKLDVNFNSGETIMRKYAGHGNWHNIKLSDHSFLTDVATEVIVRDSPALDKLIAIPKGDLIVELDESCIPITKKNKRCGEYFPLLITVVDTKTDEILVHEELLPDENRSTAFFDIITDLCSKYGKIKKLKINDPFTETLLRDFCKKSGIKLDYQQKKLVHTEKALKKAILEISNMEDDNDMFLSELFEDFSELESDESSFEEKRSKITVSKNSKPIGNSCYVISVSLGKGCYRHIKISGNASLEELHSEILSAFDFDDDHAHAFFLDNKAWSKEESYYAASSGKKRRSRDFSLDATLCENQKFLYIFDFGDEWRFQCRVLRITDEKCAEPKVIRSTGEAPAQYPDFE